MSLRTCLNLIFDIPCSSYLHSVNKDWIYNTNIYEVNLRQFTEEGTFKAFAKHMPRLSSMGVQTLWFMPVTPISEKEKKGTLGSYYACSDYTSINLEFGTMQDFKNLVKQAHKLGFMVIIDWVANHTGWDHVWTMEHPDWYEKDKNGNFKKASGMDDIIELDYKNADMRRAMIEAMKFWVRKCGIDGFRCDLASWVEIDFWMEAIPELNELKPLLWLEKWMLSRTRNTCRYLTLPMDGHGCTGPKIFARSNYHWRNWSPFCIAMNPYPALLPGLLQIMTRTAGTDQI